MTPVVMTAAIRPAAASDATSALKVNTETYAAPLIASLSLSNGIPIISSNLRPSLSVLAEVTITI
jgi:hypothetical protein